MPDSETFCSYCKKMTSFECVECGDLVEDFFLGFPVKVSKAKVLHARYYLGKMEELGNWICMKCGEHKVDDPKVKVSIRCMICTRGGELQPVMSK